MDKIGHGFLYSFSFNMLRIYEGDIYIYNNNSDTAFFMVENPKKRLGCSSNEGVIYNGMVWFLERDDQRGIDLLIEYNLNRIAVLNEKIEFIKEKIRLLDEQSFLLGEKK